MRFLFELLLRYTPGNQVVSGENKTYFYHPLNGERATVTSYYNMIDTVMYMNERHWNFLFWHIVYLFFPPFGIDYFNPFRELQLHKRFVLEASNEWTKNNWPKEKGLIALVRAI